MGFEPPKLEIFINNIAKRTFARKYYKDYVESLHLQKDEIVMDFGVGPGGPAYFILKKLAADSGKLTCVDISSRWIESSRKYLRKYSNVDFLLGTYATLEAKKNTYTSILCHFVLHELDIQEQAAAAKWLAKQLNSSGRICICDYQRYYDNITQPFLSLGFEILQTAKHNIASQGEVFSVVLVKTSPSL